MGHKSICHEPDNSDWALQDQHLFEPQVTEDEEEEEAPPAEESDWDADIDQGLYYHARPPILMRRQPPKVIMFQTQETLSWMAKECQTRSTSLTQSFEEQKCSTSGQGM